MNEGITIHGPKCPADASPYERACYRQRLYFAAADGLRRAIDDGLSPFLVRRTLHEIMAEATEDDTAFELCAALRFLLKDI